MSAPPSVLVLVTLMPVPAPALVNVPVPLKVTTSLPTIPVNVPVIVAAVEPSYVLGVTAASGIVNALALIWALRVGCVSV